MFTQKVLKITLTLNEHNEAFTVVDDKEMRRLAHSGLRASVLTNHGNGALYPTASITIYGLPIETINKIIRIKWNTINSLHNSIKVEEGSVGGDLNFFYEGQITFARLDTTSAPDVAVVIESQLAFRQTQQGAQSQSANEGVKVQDLIQTICTDINFQFENNGVDRVGEDIVLVDSSIEQIRKLCYDYAIDLSVEHELIAITNPSEPREIPVPVITPKNGLLGYPTSTWQGVAFSCLYSPLIKFHGQVEIRDSVVPMANGEWRVFGMRTQLEANMPNGAWSMEVNGTWKGSDRLVK